MKQIYAIGDIHGRDYLLERMYDRIKTDPYRPKTSETPTLIHIGDYVDGGPNSDKVIDRVMCGIMGFENIALMGNHEELLLKCLGV